MSTDAPSVSKGPQDRQRWFWLLLLGLLFAGAYAQTLWSLHLRWTKFDESYSHGYLLLGLSVYFAWLQRHRLAGARLAFNPLFVVPLLLGSIGWCLATMLGVQALAQLLLPILLLAALAAGFGYAFARCLLVPIALLYCGIPVWEDFVNTPLRDLTVAAVSNVLQLFSFPANVTGYKIEIPDGAFFVAGGCSGLAFFLTGLTISLSYAYLNLSSNFKRACFVVFCLILSVISNWVRVGALVVIGHVTHMKSPLVTVSHVMFGWYLFAAAMAIMLLVGHWIAKHDQPNDFDSDSNLRSSTKAPWLGVFAATIGLILGPAISYAYFAAPMPNVALKFAAPIAQSTVDAADWRPAYRGWTAAAHGTLPGAQSNIDIDLRYYGRQSQSSKLIGFGNRLADHKTWKELEASTVTDPSGARVKEAILSNSVGARRIVWYWFDIGGRQVIGGLRTKMVELARLISRGRTDGTLVAVSVSCPFDCDSERDLLKQSIGALRADINRALAPTK